MKKFLTVLLALSVVFTYTVGTAFAVTDENTFNGNVNTAQAQVTQTLNTNYANMATSIIDKTVSSVKVSKANWAKAAQLTKDKQLAAITARANEIKANYATLQDKTVNDLVALFSEAKGDTGNNDFGTDAPVLAQNALFAALYADTDVQNAAARYQFADDKAALIAAAKAVDLSVYSTTTPKTGDTYYAQAKAIVDNTVAEIEAVTIASDADVTAVSTALGKFGTFTTAKQDATTGAIVSVTGGSKILNAIMLVTKNDADATFVKYMLANTSIKTIADEAADALTLEATKAAYISQVNANAAAFLAANATATGDALAKVKAEKDAYVAGLSEIINAATYANIDTIADPANLATSLAKPTTDAYYTANAKLIAELVAHANKYKVYKDADGNLVKDADAIDAVVAAAKFNAYKTNAPWGDLTATMNVITNNCNAITIDSEVVAREKADIEAGRKDALDNTGYYALEEAKVNALFDELLAKVDAAKTTAEVAAVYTTNPAITGFSAIKTKAQVQDAIFGLTAYGTNKASLDAYGVYLNAGLNPTDDGYRTYPASFAKADKTNYFVNFYAEKGARTEAEVTSLLSAAKAEYDAVKTTSQAKAAKKAVEDMIAALPATITVAQSAAVNAAFDAAKAYYEETGKTDISNIATLNLAVNALYKAEKKVIDDKVAALPTTVVVADKAMYKALVAEMEAFNAKTEADKIFVGKTGFLNTEIKAITDKLVAIRGLDKAEVLKLFNALPLNITVDDKAAVEAARKAYDAYVAEYTDYTQAAPVGFEQNAAADFNPAQFKILADAEATLEAEEKINNAYLTAGVQGTKAKITSAAYKGKIVLKFSRTKGFKVDGYQLFKSTKKTSGFKSIGKTTKTSYTNTKNLVKGKRYYYKVRGYRVIGGKTVYTKFSGVVYRTAK